MEYILLEIQLKMCSKIHPVFLTVSLTPLPAGSRSSFRPMPSNLEAPAMRDACDTGFACAACARFSRGANQGHARYESGNRFKAALHAGGGGNHER